LKNRRPDPLKFLVVTKNVVMGEDLRDLLCSAGPPCEVDVIADPGAAWREGYRAAFFDAPRDWLTDEARVQAMSDRGTAIVLLDGQMAGADEAPGGIERLVQPFRSEDVLALLGRLGLRGGGPAPQ